MTETIHTTPELVDISAHALARGAVSVTVKGVFQRWSRDLDPPLRRNEPVMYEGLSIPLASAQRLRDQLNKLLANHNRE